MINSETITGTVRTTGIRNPNHYPTMHAQKTPLDIGYYGQTVSTKTTTPDPLSGHRIPRNPLATRYVGGYK